MAQRKPSDTAAAPHAGHRERLKKQFLAHGLEPMNDITVLELVLFYAIPRQDTNLIAHRLLDTFGSLSAVFDADPRDLMERGGLTESTAALIHLIPAAARRHRISGTENDRTLSTTRQCGERLVPFFLHEQDEVVYLLGLDGRCRELGCQKISDGTVGVAELSLRRLVEAALAMKAASVVLAHNHTSGSPLPSQEDAAATEQIAHALSLMGITLADHIVVGGEDFVSMAECGLMPPQQ